MHRMHDRVHSCIRAFVHCSLPSSPPLLARAAGRPRAHRSARRAGVGADGGAAPRSRPARVAGTDAARRPAQARSSNARSKSRSSDSSTPQAAALERELTAITARLLDAAGRGRRRASGARSAARRNVQAGTGAVRAAAARDLRRPPSRAGGAHGRRARQARSRSRRRASEDARRADRDARRRSRSGSRSLETLRAEARQRQRRSGARGAGAQRRRFATSIASAISTRSSPASCRARSRSCRRRFARWPRGSPAAEPASLPLKTFRGDLDWPVAGTGSAPLRSARDRRRPDLERHRDRRDRGRARHGRSRRRRRLCRRLHRVRQPGHRRSRRAGLQPLRQSARYWREKGGSGRGRPAARHRRRRR